MKNMIIKAVVVLAIAHNASAESLNRRMPATTKSVQQKTHEQVENTAAIARKKSCGTCNKPKACVVREKKSCTSSCKPKVERPKKECHTCNKCHRPVEPKATKCGRCNHPVEQSIDQQDIAVVDGAAAEQAQHIDGAAARCGKCQKKRCSKPTSVAENSIDEETAVIVDGAAA